MNKEVLHENVYYYKNVIEDPEKLINLIELTDFKDYGKSITKWTDWNTCSGLEYTYGTEKRIYLSEEEKQNFDMSNEISYIFHTINNAIYNVYKDYAESKNDLEEPNYYKVFDVKKYKAGTYMGGHFDQQEGDSRLKYSIVMYLNDDYHGGEISFKINGSDNPLDSSKGEFIPDYDIAKEKGIFDFAIKPEAGSAIIFPSSPPYHHTAHLVKNGFKYMIPSHWMHKQ